MPDSQPFDMLVVGAGPGGYVAAVRAAQLGYRTACIDRESRFGGTCLRVGCIPSKALLDATEKLYLAQHRFADLGIKVEKLSVDLPTMMARKDRIVDTLAGGVSALMKKNKIEKIVGSARFVSPDSLEITASEGSRRVVSARHIIIATGSAPIELPFMKFDGQRIISSDQAIALDSVPESLLVIGGGAIGLELGSVWSRLGASVAVLEMLPQLVAGADEEMARALEKSLKKQGLNIFTQARVTGAKDDGTELSVQFQWEGKEHSQSAQRVLVAVGRRPCTDGLDLDAIGVNRDDRGCIEVDRQYCTNIPGVYAIGDVIAGPMLAHKAEEEGIACVELIAGKAGHVNYGVIPSVVYTAPELAWVGRTQEQCTAEKILFNSGKFHFRVNGRALAMDEPEGFVKVIAHGQTDRLLGVHILGAHASSMIAEAAAVMEFAGSADDLGRICHAHPTLPEAVKEAALGALKRAIHA